MFCQITNRRALEGCGDGRTQTSAQIVISWDEVYEKVDFEF
jgi:hypothetical protein